ncbi:hypothetical protein CVT24_004087 [Panaeolus cyanescens]|uniref:Uncharacterized protein n=1 Tax=Panaeolus cyanescens TaxID=181874 RepID=A0A409Y646_9AGAR|nr:hypothetical protein CVT24_004087 [Panaeolus cyanescens]
MADIPLDLFHEDIWAIFIVRCANCSVLSLLVWDWLLTLSLEISTIWNSIDSVLTLRIHATRGVDPQICRWWFGAQSLTAILLIFVLELLLTVRVLALYSKSRPLSVLLLGLLASKTVAMAALSIFMIRNLAFGSLCLVEDIPATAISVCVLQVVTQAIIWLLTLFRRFQVTRRNRSPIPLVDLVTRDGSWAFVLITVIFAVALFSIPAVHCGGTLTSYKSKHFQAIFPLVTAAPSISRRWLSSTSSSRAALASKLPTKPTVVISTPSLEYIEAEEIDVDLIPADKVQLEITDRAAEQLMNIANRNSNPQAALRVSVESGGCHGYQYKLELAKQQSPDDYHFAHPSIKPSNILVDAVSFSLLNGSTIDFATELIGSSFQVLNNPQAKDSGCGCGVSWELKE